MLPAPPWVIARVVYGTDARQQNLLVVHFNLDAAPADPPNDVTTFADTLYGAYSGPFSNVLCNNSFFEGVAVSLNVSGVIYNATASAAPLAGTVVSDELPDYAAVVLQKRTGHGGRTGRGRWFLGGVPESLTDTNHLTAGGITAYEALSDVLLSDQTIGAATATPALYSAKDSNFYALTQVIVDRTLGTQKRRLVRPLI